MLDQPSILVIEDEARLRNNLRTLLQKQGYRVRTAGNGAAGIQQMQAESFDLVITDIVMPNMDGFQVMEYLQDHCTETIVVATTAYVSTESAIEALRKGAYDYLTKPFDLDLMQIVIKRGLEKARLQKVLRHYMSELEQKVEERTRELTEVKKRLEQSLAELKAAREHLIKTEKLRVVGEVTGCIAYELTDPLTVIVSFAQLLAKEVPTEGRMRAQLDYISEAAIRCNQIVRSLSSFSEAKANLNALAYRVNLSSLLRDRL